MILIYGIPSYSIPEWESLRYSQNGLMTIPQLLTNGIMGVFYDPAGVPEVSQNHPSPQILTR